MKKEKENILLQLKIESLPVTLKHLISKLPSNYSERSIRRWLNELVIEGFVKKIGRKRGTQYQLIDEKISFFSPASDEAIFYIKKPLYERIPTTYNEEWIESYEPNGTFYLSLALRKKLHQSGRRMEGHDPAGIYAHQIFNRLLIDLSYNSSRLEGNTYSLLDTEKLILKGEQAEGKSEEETIMIVNHKEAIRYLVDNASRLQITFEPICTLHYLLSDGLLEAQLSGKIREHSVRIGGSVYLPFANPKKIRFYLDRIVQKGALIEDPFEQSLFLLVHLSYLQAFADVNKRTARLSANIPLITNNFVPLSFKNVERADYNMAIIAIYELQDVRPIVDLYMMSYLKTCLEYDSTVKSLGYDYVRVRFRQQRRAILQKIIESRLVGKELKNFIDKETVKEIPQEDRQSFVKNIIEDLNLMDESRIAGLGISVQQLSHWLSHYRKEPLK